MLRKQPVRQVQLGGNGLLCSNPSYSVHVVLYVKCNQHTCHLVCHYCTLGLRFSCCGSLLLCVLGWSRAAPT
jgi:hypothetical protein